MGWSELTASATSGLGGGEEGETALPDKQLPPARPRSTESGPLPTALVPGILSLWFCFNLAGPVKNMVCRCSEFTSLWYELPILGTTCTATRPSEEGADGGSACRSGSAGLRANVGKLELFPVISAEGPTGTEATETLFPTRRECLGSWDSACQIAAQFWLLVLSLI